MKSTIISQIQQIAAERKLALSHLDDDLPLLETGLDSLSFAILVARLEDLLGIDPFTASDEVYYPTTVGDLIGVYEKYQTTT
jgi:acyl carrier protein